jgi:hypothetical protein
MRYLFASQRSDLDLATVSLTRQCLLFSQLRDFLGRVLPHQSPLASRNLFGAITQIESSQDSALSTVVSNMGKHTVPKLSQHSSLDTNINLSAQISATPSRPTVTHSGASTVIESYTTLMKYDGMRSDFLFQPY